MKNVSADPCSSEPAAMSQTSPMCACTAISFPTALLCVAVAVPALAAGPAESKEPEWKQVLEEFKATVDPLSRLNDAEKKWLTLLEEFSPSQIVLPVPSDRLCQQIPKAPAGWKREETRCQDSAWLAGRVSEAWVSYSKNKEAILVVVMDGGFFPLVYMQTAQDVLRPSRPPISKPKMKAIVMGAWPAAVDETGSRLVLVVGRRYIIICDGRAATEFIRSIAEEVARQLASFK